LCELKLIDERRRSSSTMQEMSAYLSSGIADAKRKLDQAARELGDARRLLLDLRDVLQVRGRREFETHASEVAEKLVKPRLEPMLAGLQKDLRDGGLNPSNVKFSRELQTELVNVILRYAATTGMLTKDDKKKGAA
jgi:hypothetical protein